MMTCGRCGGTGRHSYNPRDGDVCYGCRGQGMVPARRRRTAPPRLRQLPATVSLEALCGGDPTKLDPRNTVALEYLGLTPETLATYADLWRRGLREVPNPYLTRPGE